MTSLGPHEQSLSATHKRQAGVEPVAAAPVELEPSSVTEVRELSFDEEVRAPDAHLQLDSIISSSDSSNLPSPRGE